MRQRVSKPNLSYALASRVRRLVQLFTLALLLGIALPASPVTYAATLPAGFQESTVFSGLTNPTAFRFAPDGRVFVAEKRGVIKVFDRLNDPTPDVFADLNVNVYNFWDRGLLGLALDPKFPDESIRVCAVHLRPRTRRRQRRRRAGVHRVSTPIPVRPHRAQRVTDASSADVFAATSRRQRMTGSEQVLIEDWCQQYPSHSVGQPGVRPRTAHFTPAAATERASTSSTTGQDGARSIPAATRPVGVGATLTPPTAEGGALRSQDLRTTGDPVVARRRDPAR